MFNDKIINDILIKYNIDGIVITSGDEFNSEYTPQAQNLLFQFTGFAGSNGIAFLAKDTERKFFITDGRYITEANELLAKKGFTILEIGATETNNILSQFKSLGFIEEVLQYTTYLKWSKYTALIPISKNDVSASLLKNERNPINTKTYYHFDSGEDSANKIAKVLKQSNNADCILITDSASVCWLLNIRENCEFDGIHKAFCILWNDGAIELIYNKNNIMQNHKLYNKNINLIPQQTPYSIYTAIEKICKITKLENDYIAHLKAIKNQTEINGFISCHKKDAIAVQNAISKIKSLVVNNNLITEYSCSQILLEERKKFKTFISQSFETIAGFNKNGAIVHYKPNKDNSQIITKDGLLLLDSGGNYTNGTTDITRTIATGKPTDEMIFHYTLVLKSHIALASLNFPQNVKANQLDAITRQHLWHHGLDYKHGTGHGVGYYLSVHEFPSISPNATYSLTSGMVVSIEPGLYFENKYGIRLENLYLVQKNSNNLLYFHPLTLVPFEDTLINKETLSREELKWLEEYHLKCNL